MTTEVLLTAGLPGTGGAAVSKSGNGMPSLGRSHPSLFFAAMGPGDDEKGGTHRLEDMPSDDNIGGAVGKDKPQDSHQSSPGERKFPDTPPAIQLPPPVQPLPSCPATAAEPRNQIQFQLSQLSLVAESNPNQETDAHGKDQPTGNCSDSSFSFSGGLDSGVVQEEPSAEHSCATSLGNTQLVTHTSIRLPTEPWILGGVADKGSKLQHVNGQMQPASDWNHDTDTDSLKRQQHLHAQHMLGGIGGAMEQKENANPLSTPHGRGPLPQKLNGVYPSYGNDPVQLHDTIRKPPNVATVDGDSPETVIIGNFGVVNTEGKIHSVDASDTAEHWSGRESNGCVDQPDGLSAFGCSGQLPPQMPTIGLDMVAAPFSCSVSNTECKTSQSPVAGTPANEENGNDKNRHPHLIVPTGATPSCHLLPPVTLHQDGTNTRQLSQAHVAPQRKATVSATRPILYSAIGSLECSSLQSLGSFNMKLMGSRKVGMSVPQTPSKSSTDPESLTCGDQTRTNFTAVKYLQPKEHLSGHTASIPVQAESVPVQSNSHSTEAENGCKTHCSSDKKRDMPEREHREVMSKISAPANNSSNQTLRRGRKNPNHARQENKHVTIDTSKQSTTIAPPQSRRKGLSRHEQGQPKQMFRPSCDAYTPRMDKRKNIQYRPAELRTPHVQKMSTTMGTIQRPNYRDALRRVAMIIQQHVVKIERRFESGVKGLDGTGLFLPSMRDLFSEANFVTPRYKCSMVRLPMARPGVVYGLRRIKEDISSVPSTADIYEFGHHLFKSVKLSSECSIVCLIYVERLMEVAKVPLMACTWRPIFMCGLLLASKVWQDLSSWNIEFASVYPQFSRDSINRLEALFLKLVRWDLYISSSLYAKYYFALRSILEKQDFRHKYNQMVGAVGSHNAVSDALKVQKRSEMVKEEVLLQLSKSM